MQPMQLCAWDLVSQGCRRHGGCFGPWTMMQRSGVLEANLANVLIAELVGEDTLPHARLSAPYERVDVVEVPAPELRRTRRRAATISREDLALRVKARAEAATVAMDAARTLRFSAPYERIEVEQLDAPLLTTGRFEAAWFVAPDDVPHTEPDQPAASRLWFWILPIMIATCAAAVFAITMR